MTSRQGRPIYDPVGKYCGLFLFVTIGVTLLLPDPVASQFLFNLSLNAAQ